MRLFIAAELPTSVTEALAETSALLRDSVRGRFVSPDSFHVTLAFLGDVDVRHSDLAIDAIEEACAGVEPFEVALGDLGSFGRRSKATLWQGFRDAGALADVAAAVRSGLKARDVPFDDKSFLAHVTLMRQANLSGGILPSPVLAEGPVEAITLFRSDLSGPRPRYEPLYRRMIA